MARSVPDPFPRVGVGSGDDTSTFLAMASVWQHSITQQAAQAAVLSLNAIWTRNRPKFLQPRYQTR